MYGSTIGNLTLFQRVDNVDSPLWSKTKAEGDKWWPALVTVRSASKPFQVCIIISNLTHFNPMFRLYSP